MDSFLLCNGPIKVTLPMFRETVASDHCGGSNREGILMLNKISGLARSLYILLAIIAGFVAMGGVNVALVLVVLGLIAGISMPMERMVLAGVSVLALPVVGAALGNIPAIGAQLGAVTNNLALGIAGALASAFAILLYGLVMAGITGMTGSGAASGSAAAA